MKLISFCMYGNSSTYLDGAVANAELAPVIYPGWEMVVFHDASADVEALKKLGVRTEGMGTSLEHSGMLWRFLPAWWPGVSRVIFRDTDSRLNYREAAAVDEWERSGLNAHCMHDHLHHRSLPLFGGMWGVRGGVLPKRVEGKMTGRMTRPVKRGGDMQFLSQCVLPEIESSLLRHSSYDVKWHHVPFPAHRPVDGFVGQQYGPGGVSINP